MTELRMAKLEAAALRKVKGDPLNVICKETGFSKLDIEAEEFRLRAEHKEQISNWVFSRLLGCVGYGLVSLLIGIQLVTGSYKFLSIQHSSLRLEVLGWLIILNALFHFGLFFWKKKALSLFQDGALLAGSIFIAYAVGEIFKPF